MLRTQSPSRKSIKKQTYRLIGLSLLISLTGCGVGPLVSEKTAQTLPKKQWEVQMGSSPFSYVWLGRGVSDNMDVNINLENQGIHVLSLGTKYAISQQPEGFSTAVAGGVFTSQASYGFFSGPVISMRKKWFEAFGLLKYTHARWKGSDHEYDDDFAFDHDTTEDETFNYWLVSTGVNIRFSKNTDLNLGVKYILGGETSSKGDEPLPSIAVIFRP